MSNRETDVEMNNTGAAKVVANNSGSNDGAAQTAVELQCYDAVDSVVRGIWWTTKLQRHRFLSQFLFFK